MKVPGQNGTSGTEKEGLGESKEDTVFIFIFFRAFFFYHSITALHCRVSFSCTIEWISYIHTYIHSLLSLPPTTLIPPLQVITEHQAELPLLWRQLVLKVLLKKKCIQSISSDLEIKLMAYLMQIPLQNFNRDRG